MKLSQWPWALWWAQIRAVLRLEMKKGFFARRALWIYLLAFAPVLLFAARSMRAQDDIGESTHTFAAVFQFFFLRLSVFFGCVGIFINLIRGDVLEKSLHYYFLAPVRREVLLAGKYLSGMLAAVVIFGTSAVLQFAALYWHFGWDQVQ